MAIASESYLDEYGKKRIGKFTITWKIVLLVFSTTTLIYFLFFNSANTFKQFSIGNNKDFYYPDQEDLERYGIQFYDLQDHASHSDGWNYEERVLFLVPLRDASAHLPMLFSSMKNMTYPHHLIDISFFVSDTKDSTISDLKRHLAQIQSDADPEMHFGRINIYEKDFGQIIGQSFSDRHGFAAQGPRRKLMAIARNWLLTTAIRPDHSWVYWRDADVETIPATIIEDLMHHNKDVIVPNIWRPLPDWLGNEQPYDLNSWQESEAGLDLADKLDEDAVIVEGYSEYATWRVHLGYLRDPFGDEETEMDLDGIGGVSILSKSKVFRSGAMFPAFSYLNHAETEGFGKLCKTMGFRVIGLPHYVIWHIYEPSVTDLQHMKWMAEEKKNRVKIAKIKKLYNKRWTEAFEEVDKEWESLKFNVFKNTDLKRRIELDWEDVDGYLRKFDDNNIYPELEEFEMDRSFGALNQRYIDGYIPSNEIFDSYPLTNAAANAQFQFVRFDDDDRFDDSNANNKDSNLAAKMDANKVNSGGDDQRRKKLLEKLREQEEEERESQNDLLESKKGVEEEIQKVESEKNNEIERVKAKDDLTPKDIEAEIRRLNKIYEEKKKLSEEKKLAEEAERLSKLALAKKKKKLLKQKNKEAANELRKKAAVDKEIERRRAVFNDQS